MVKTALPPTLYLQSAVFFPVMFHCMADQSGQRHMRQNQRSFSISQTGGSGPDKQSSVLGTI